MSWRITFFSKITVPSVLSKQFVSKIWIGLTKDLGTSKSFWKTKTIGHDRWHKKKYWIITFFCLGSQKSNRCYEIMRIGTVCILGQLKTYVSEDILICLSHSLSA